MSKKILITPKSFKTYKDKAYPLLTSKGFDIIENTLDRTYTEDEIIVRAKNDVVGIIIGVDPLSARVLEQCLNLKAISKYGVGMDNIDLNKAKSLGIKVKNAFGTNNISVAESTIALMFCMARSLYPATRSVKSGGWDRIMGCELAGKKLGLLGCGQIGREVAKRARGLELEVIIYDPNFNDQHFLTNYNIERASNLSDIFTCSDFISLHVPSTSETKGIICKETLRLMKSSAFLINTSRGDLIDEDALYNALVDKGIAGAAQDVFSSEPPEEGHRLLKLDNFILTPHIGAFTNEAVERMVMISTKNMLEMLEQNV